MARFLYVAMLFGAAVAMPWDGAFPTPGLDAMADYQGFSPATTQGAIDLLDIFNEKRGVTDICGYEEHVRTSRRFCSSPYICATNTDFSAYACCISTRTAQCKFKTSCVPHESISICGSSCSNDDRLRICTEATEPYCETAYSYTGSHTFTGFACRSTSDGLTAHVYPTYSSRSGSPSSSDSSETLTSTVSGSVTVITKEVAPSGTGTTADGAEDPDITSSTLSTNNGFASGASSSVPSPKKKGTAIGPIVGGVVGGIAVLGGIIGAIVFFLLRKKKTDAAAPVAAGAGAVPPQGGYAAAGYAPPGYGPPPGTQPYVDPNQPPYMQQQYNPNMQPATPYGAPPPPFAGAATSYYDPKGMAHTETDQKPGGTSQHSSPVPPPVGLAQGGASAGTPTHPPAQQPIYEAP
ncbi:hypothetical protein P152DRAFT_454203 [Eremomyces bilateralis CBS 781.70]|uniref:Mid2 domain-containing protein n=1 Tax=Eremomyces bilateralis CBS 781.70 TaxID=1392243 RepID=A0A6G1GIE0_9PEZI|nr:uncharacterized protein P152DRAFT_454203 [Eremomyces bilateralis CBS 781.70]KAF1817630.1 hypothetical protein P152DRAFT_454203 [Eremomyces bilateralis CBS 781.70]